jgi:hypothetical protein
MARIDRVKRENLGAPQQKLYDDIMRSRPRATPIDFGALRSEIDTRVERAA